MVSIIIPVYNVKNYLNECVESVINQTYKNLEIILVNDGSNDGSELLVNELAEIDSRIKVVHQENAGLSAARNTGMRVMNGDYFFFLDSDDVIHPETIQIMLNSAKKNNAEVVVGSLTTFFGDDCADFSMIRLENRGIVYTGKEFLLSFIGNWRLESVVAVCKLFKNTDEKKWFPVGKLHEDEFFTYKAIYPLMTCVYIQCGFYFYRQREKSITNLKSEKNYKDTIEAFTEKIEFYKKMDEEILLQEALIGKAAIYEKLYLTSRVEKQKEVYNNYRKYYCKDVQNNLQWSKTKLKFYLYSLNYNLFKLILKLRNGRKNENSKNN